MSTLSDMRTSILGGSSVPVRPSALPLLATPSASGGSAWAGAKYTQLRQGANVQSTSASVTHTCARLPGTLPWHSALALCCPTFKTPLSMMVIFAALLGLATAVPHSGAGKVEVKFFAEAVSQAVSLLCRRAAHPHHLRVRRIAAVTRVPDGRDGPGQPDPVGRGHRGHHGL